MLNRWSHFFSAEKTQDILANQRLLQSQMGERLDYLQNRLDQNQILQGLILEAARANKHIRKLSEVEFNVFSQFGDDGIIAYLLDCLKLARDQCRFVEFGVQNYRESNTRYLLLTRNWSGLVMDGDQGNIDFIRGDGISWRHELYSRQCWITRDNINGVLGDAGFTQDIGLLHIDLDGNDYWVWQKLEVVSPRLLILEYNSLFGPHHRVTVPYAEGFERTNAHYSGQYWGASLTALVHLSRNKGYEWIGCNEAGNNAYFVRQDCLPALAHLLPNREFVRSKFRDSRNQDGGLTFLSGPDRLAVIAAMPLIDLTNNQIIKCSDL